MSKENPLLSVSVSILRGDIEQKEFQLKSLRNETKWKQAQADVSYRKETDLCHDILDLKRAIKILEKVEEPNVNEKL